jgi:cell division cycle 20-like protein 1 (cofactor of APC complex)
LLFTDANYTLKIQDLEKDLEIMKFESINRRFLKVESISENILLLGADSSYVDLYDLRTKHKIRNLYKHEDSNEVCNIKYSQANKLIISGGNDNNIILFDLRKEKISKVFKHKAAVKAISVNPSQSLLVSGGGTFDKTIKLWDLKKLTAVSECVTDSQITNIEFLSDDEFLVANGYISNNIVLYEISEERVKATASMEKHNKRILYMSKSKDDLLASCSTDGVVKIWKLNKYIAKNRFEDNNVFCAIR